MKVFIYPALLGMLILGSCSDEMSNPEQVQRIEEINIFDIGNQGNASDVSVTFKIENISNISEFRLFLVPSNKLKEFDKNQAFLLSSDRYMEVALANDPSYFIRFSEIRDIEGNPIAENKKYFVKILMLGEQFNQLSFITSNELSLVQQGVYVGSYSGFLRHNVGFQGRFDEIIRTINLDGNFTEGSVPNRYLGTFGNNGTIRFTVNENTIEELEISGNIGTNVNTFVSCESENTGMLTASLTSEFQLQIVGEGCLDGIFEINLIRSLGSGL